MAATGSTTRWAGSAALAAAAIWSTYYLLVLVFAPEVGAAGLLVWPFLAGGVGLLAMARWRGESTALASVFRSPGAYLRAALMLAMQLAVLGATLQTGAVDTALLTLLGDVACTPLLLVALFGEGRERLVTAGFLTGLLLSLAGATLTILGGSEARAVAGLDWVLVPAVPLSVAAYFIAMARANRERPVAAGVGHATLLAGLMGLAISPWLPGGLSGLGVPGALPVLGLVAVGLTTFWVAPVLYFEAIRRAGILLPSLLMATIPLFTLALAAAFLGFVPGLLALIGVPVAGLGALFAVRADATGARARPP